MHNTLAVNGPSRLTHNTCSKVIISQELCNITSPEVALFKAHALQIYSHTHDFCAVGKMSLIAVLEWAVSCAVGDTIWETTVRLSGLLGALFLLLLFLVRTPNSAHHVYLLSPPSVVCVSERDVSTRARPLQELVREEFQGPKDGRECTVPLGD